MRDMDANAALIEELYARYSQDPQSVEPSWRHFFEGMAFGEARGPSEAPSDLRVHLLIHAYRHHGHLLAKVNPIDAHPVSEVPQLSLQKLGFLESELDKPFPTCGLLEKEEAPLREIIERLKSIYCDRIGIEYMGVERPEMVAYLRERVEQGRPNLSIDQKRLILDCLNKAELFEIFLHTKYVGQKRFSLEGGETLIPLMEALIEEGAEHGLSEFVIGMAHRGRLNVLVNILNKSYSNIFHEFEDSLIEESFYGTGDVKYHKGFSADVTTSGGKSVHLSLTANPSHLESVDAVVQGQVRAKQVLKGDDKEMRRIAPILIHGDAALAGQGVVYETMELSGLAGYNVGGTLHLVVNNQIGFTTLPKDSRSTRYCTDLARTFSAPVFHVNGEDPEGCFYAAMLALECRQKFGCDVFIDLNCYRKYGHNEADEPAFTQPLEYALIRKKSSPRVIYRDELIQQGVIEKKLAEELEAKFRAALQAELDEVQTLKTEPFRERASTEWQAVREANWEEDPFLQIDTSVPVERLREVAQAFCAVPEGFNLNRKIKKLAEDRMQMAKGDPSEARLNWGMAEHLAFATLLKEGLHVRVAGQDCRRGTFNHRHAMWMDQKEEGKYFPLNHVGEGRFDVFNSPLSEFACLAFEYGYSLSYVQALVIWEAQFGDFANGAQVVIDQYVSSSEQKWHRLSGLVMMLPHGYEGQGPEHSSARMERYLQSCGNQNMRVVNCTTPAQIFHVLRRQVLRKSRKPLIIFTPKQLFGHPACVSSLNELASGQFQEVIDDTLTSCRRLIFCSGRLYYDLIEERTRRGITDMAIVRLEQLYPLHEERIKEIVSKYAGFSEALWVQEEPENMGAWEYIRDQLGVPLRYVGRERSASPATGSPKKHKAQHKAILDGAFG